PRRRAPQPETAARPRRHAPQPPRRAPHSPAARPAARDGGAAPPARPCPCASRSIRPSRPLPGPCGRPRVTASSPAGRELWEWASLVVALLLHGARLWWHEGVIPRTGPFFVAALRLLPAAALLVRFRVARGRKQPSGWEAWLDIAAFGLIDAACFQARLSRGGIAEDVGWARERKAKSKLPLSWGSCFSRFFSPLGMVPVIALAGLGLFERGFPVIGTCVEIGLPMLVLFVALSQYLKHVQVCHFPILERFSVLISIALVWLYAHILTVSGAYKHSSQVTQLNCRTDRANLITTMPWFDVPYPLQWGPPTFSADHSFGMMAAVVVSLVESTGAFKAAARLASATPPPPFVLSRGIGWQGIGLLLDGLFGTASGATVSVENVGLLGSTRIGSRRVIQISAGFMIFFSILGKFGALFASIPFTLFAAIYCVLFGYVGM
ncbi:nucleobase-ascorbate transporter 2-like, partial [Miscanthus floridulus]|uniref:nucleobase-ascorbate transporter 2-like n=1 Tax=Miscanthus floridulus TaxID=154761 RepID=UPI00345912F9